MKIGLCGTISCGKTTLVKELQKLEEFKGYHFATERSKYLRDLGIPLNTDSTLSGQIVFLSERVVELFQNNLITDRSIIDVMTFSNLSKSMNVYEKREFEWLASNLLEKYDYIFYVSPKGVQLEDNGVRIVNEEYRQKLDEEIHLLLKHYKHKIKNLHYLEGTTEDRIAKIKGIIFS